MVYPQAPIMKVEGVLETNIPDTEKPEARLNQPDMRRMKNKEKQMCTICWMRPKEK